MIADDKCLQRAELTEASDVSAMAGFGLGNGRQKSEVLERGCMTLDNGHKPVQVMLFPPMGISGPLAGIDRITECLNTLAPVEAAAYGGE